jgi:type I restriction enzyme S subunit
MLATTHQNVIRPGYKHTEVGVIPDDWKVQQLRDVTTLMTNGFVGKARPHYTEGDDGVVYIQGFNVEENSFNLTGIRKVTRRFHAQHLRSCLREGDLLTIQTGEVGLTTIVPKELAGSNCHALVISRFNNRFHDPKYFSYYFNSFVGRSKFADIETGSTMKHLNVGDMLGVYVPSPPTKAEQSAIASALTDVDALLASQDKLIAKKRDMKTGAMQQLLAGKRRLPGFTGAWETVDLGALFTFKNGLNKGKEFFGEGTPIVNYMDVYEHAALYYQRCVGRVTVSKHELKNFDVKRGDVFFTRTLETVDEIGMAAVMLDEPKDTVFSGFLLRARPRDERLCDGFKRYCFASRSVRSQIVSKSSYTTRALTNGKLLSGVVILVPTVKEQEAIATVLSDIDAEIAALEIRRDKTRTLKQGMMQQLLTGSIRLI